MSRCPINKAVVSFLLTKLPSQGPPGNARETGLISEAGLRSVLIARNVERNAAARLARNASIWSRPNPKIPDDYPTPDSAQLLELANAFDESLDVIFDHHPTPKPQPKTPVIDGLADVAEWFPKFIRQANNLSCYVIVLPNQKLAAWKRESSRVDSSDIPETVKLGQRWASELKVFEASFKLRKENGWGANSDLGTKTMEDLLQRRLKWIKQVPDHGTALYELARLEVYCGIVRAVSDEIDHGVHERYPSMRRGELKSLRVGFDSIPGWRNDAAWLIDYQWGPPLSEQKVMELLRSRSAVTG